MSGYTVFRREQERLSGVCLGRKLVRIVIGLWRKFQAPQVPLRMLYYTIGADV